MRGDVARDSGDFEGVGFSQQELSRILHFAQGVALEAGELVRTAFCRRKEVAVKSGRELVTLADIASERLISQKIRDEFPQHRILSEELCSDELLSAPCLWVVDPLDGTNNFAHGFPFFCISIAFVHCGLLQVGVVYDPLRREMFWATAFSDAFLNGDRIVVSQVGELSRALVATGFPYDRTPVGESNVDNFVRFAYVVQGIRRAGSAALDLCYVACGRLDGFWELRLRPWDMAAGALIVRRAGGVATDFDGAEWTLRSDRIVAANPKLHPKMLELLRMR